MIIMFYVCMNMCIILYIYYIQYCMYDGSTVVVLCPSEVEYVLYMYTIYSSTVCMMEVVVVLCPSYTLYARFLLIYCTANMFACNIFCYYVVYMYEIVLLLYIIYSYYYACMYLFMEVISVLFFCVYQIY